MNKTKGICLIVLSIIFIFIFASFKPSYALTNAEIPIATAEQEKKLLGGTTPEEARKQYALGIASKFSVFLNGKLTIKAADTGGKVAAKEGIDASGIKNPYDSSNDGVSPYQIGAGYYDYESKTNDGTADIIIGNGQLSNIAFDFGATTKGNAYPMQRNIVVSNDIDDDNLTGIDAVVSKFYKSNIINFDDEFEYLKEISQELTKYASTYIETNTVTTRKDNHFSPEDDYFSNVHITRASSYSDSSSGSTTFPIVHIFKGRNKKINVFTVSNEDLNSFENVLFDVPAGSYVVVNVLGENVTLSGNNKKLIDANARSGYYEKWDRTTDFKNKNIFYPISQDEYDDESYTGSELDIATYCSTSFPDYYDLDGNVKHFVKVLDEKNRDKGEYILWNLPEATNFNVQGNWTGTVLAPNAVGSDKGTVASVVTWWAQNYGKTISTIPNADIKTTGDVVVRRNTYWCQGHIAGSIICKSYTGYQEIGSETFTMPLSYLDERYEYFSGVELPFVKKDSITNEKVEGAVFGLFTEPDNILYDENVPIVTTTTDKDGNAKIVAYNLPENYKYYVKEISAPDIYSISPYEYYESKPRYGYIQRIPNGAANAYNYRLTMTVDLTKYYKDTTDPIEGVEFGVYAAEDVENSLGTKFKKDELVASATTDPDGKVSFEFSNDTTILPLGKYYLKEISAPGNLAISEKKYEFTMDQDNAHKTESFTAEDDYINIQIIKKDAVTGESLKGAKLKLLDSTGIEVDSWTTTKDPYVIEKIEAGEYTIVEESAPENYLKSNDLKIIVKQVEGIQTFEMKDDFTKVKISKIDSLNGKIVPGAKLQLLDSNGNEVATWTTTEEPYVIEKLPVGKYKLVELEVPAGYIKSEDVEFTVEQTGEVNNVEMLEQCIVLEITEYDEKTKEPIIGAELKLVDSTGKEIATWTTTKDAYRIERIPAGEYTIKKISLPDGYINSDDRKIEVKAIAELQKEEIPEKKKEEPVIPEEPEEPEEPVVPEEPEEPVEPQEPEAPTPVQTGDKIMIAVIILGISIISLIVVSKSKKKK